MKTTPHIIPRPIVAMRSLLLFAMLAFAGAITAPAQTPAAKPQAPPPGVIAHRDLVYADVDGIQLKLDLFVPDTATPEKPVPLIVWVHGGGWRNQSKANCFAFRHNFMGRGYAVASVDYRLSDKAKFPAQIQDCKAAVRWLRANAATYNIAPDRIGAWGSSAGGHLVMLLGLTAGKREFDVGAHLDVSSSVQAVANYYGPVDFTGKHIPAETEKIESPVALLLGGPVSKKMELAVSASPLTYVSKNAAPLFTVHGTKDLTVNVAHAKLMLDAMTKAGASAKLTLIEGAGHSGKPFANKKILDEVDAFFTAHLKTPPGGAGVPPAKNAKVFVLPETVLVEAESFTDKGGWLVDQQYMDRMGSPVLLAHGIGKPVADATTVVEFPKTGKYRVFVRTRNWVAKWTPQYAPGIFKLVVNGTPLAATFGNTGAAWHWQDGGTVEITKAKTALALRDLTGFEGRCDAILFTADPAFTPPEDAAALAAFRRAALGLIADPKDAPNAPEGPFDLVVGGGGFAGMCAAITAARLGVKVALIQDRPVLGGNNSSEIRVHLRGRINFPPYKNIGNVVGQLDPLQTGIAQPAEQYGDDQKLALILAEKNITLYLSTRITDLEMDTAEVPEGYTRPAIKAVFAQNIETGRELRFEARWFADCTGDGTLGFLSGAECHMGRESRAQTGESLAPEKPDDMTLGSSIPWNTAEKFDASGKPLATIWPKLPWALQFNNESGHPEIKGDWDWESGLEKDQIDDVEEIRDNLFRAIYGHWSWMKNQTPAGWEEKVHNRELTWVPFVMGKRESRRIMGDVILRQQEIILRKPFDDGCVMATWDIDLHYPTDLHRKYFPGAEFKAVSDRRVVRMHLIPYRCFYSKDVPNLFMAGRNISVTHVALGSVRVMRTTGMMGEVVGMAASVCKDNNATPREVYQKHFPKLAELMKNGVAPKPKKYQRTARPKPDSNIPAPEWLAYAGINLATNARLEISGTLAATKDTMHRINDGTFDYDDERRLWVSEKHAGPHYVALRYFEPITINALRVVSGVPPGVKPVTDFVLQRKVEDGSGGADEWVDVPQTGAKGNTKVDFGQTFPRTTSREFRLLITKTPDDIASIWDVQLYELDN